MLSIEKKDLFLAVSARSYQPTVFGSSLEHLARLDHPIRDVSIKKRQRIASVVASLKKPRSEWSTEEKNDAEQVRMVGVPKAIHQLVNFLAEYALDAEDLFSEEGDTGLIKVARESLDTVRRPSLFSRPTFG